MDRREFLAGSAAASLLFPETADALMGSRRIAALSAGAPLWTPLLLGASLTAWWSALQSSSITLATSNVSAWSSIVGGITATQATGANQPTYSATGFDGSRPSINFDAAPKYLVNTTIAAMAQPITIAAVFRYATQSQFSIILGLDSTGLGNRIVLFSFRPETYFAPTMYAGANVVTSAAYSNGQKYVQVASFNGSASTSSLNGSLSGTFNPGAYGGIGGALISGATAATAFIGGIGEVCYITAALGTVSHQKLEGYQAWKWGLQSSLPADHPYKSTPPRASLAECEQWADEQGWRVIDLAANRERARRIYAPPRRLIVPDHGWMIAA
jgi:hypothetical protein